MDRGVIPGHRTLYYAFRHIRGKGFIEDTHLHGQVRFQLHYIHGNQYPWKSVSTETSIHIIGNRGNMYPTVPVVVVVVNFFLLHPKIDY